MHRLLLAITEDCNLSCDYCYVSRSSNKISERNAFAAIDMLKRQKVPVGKKLELIITGGEPFLEYELLNKIVSYARETIGSGLFIGIPTNGTLLDKDKLEFAKRNNINIGISIDGLGDGNKHRPCIDGKDSFSAIRSNIRLFLKYRSNIRIRLTIMPSEAEMCFKRFVSFCALGFSRIDLQPAVGIKWSDSQISKFMSQLEKVVNFSKVHHIDVKGIIDRCESLENPSCNKIDNEMLVDASGNIYPCAFFLFFPPAERKKYLMGSVVKGLVTDNIHIDKLRKFVVCQDIKKCSKCIPSVACTKYCFTQNVITRKPDVAVEESAFILERSMEKLIKNNRDKGMI